MSFTGGKHIVPEVDQVPSGAGGATPRKYREGTSRSLSESNTVMDTFTGQRTVGED